MNGAGPLGGAGPDADLERPVPVRAETDPADGEELRDRLHAFNAEVTGFDDGRALSAFVRDDAGRLLAGIDGFSWGGYARVEYLWVDASLRGRGWGRRLMTAIADEARRRGCRTLVVDTHTFQAPGFYQALGFREVGRTRDTPVGYDQVLYSFEL